MTPVVPRLRFSVRTLLGATSIFCVLTGLYFASVRDEVQTERRMETEISKLGGTTFAANYRPAWLQKLLVDQDLANITAVHLDETNVTDGELASLAVLPRLGGLHLRDTKVSDDAFTHINRLYLLVQLDLSKTRVRHVQLRGLSHLEDLNLTGNELAQLELIDLPKLRSLNLGFSSADDSDLLGLITISSLESLDLRNTQVSDKGIGHLRDLKALRTLYVYDTAVTVAGANTLQRTLPMCQIIGAR